MSAGDCFTFTAPYEPDHDPDYRGAIRPVPDDRDDDDTWEWSMAAEHGFLARAVGPDDRVTGRYEDHDAVLDNGLTVDVKCRPERKKDLGLPESKFYRESHACADVYVLTWWRGDVPDNPESGQFEYVGWATLEDIENGETKWWREPTMYVPWENLNGRGTEPKRWRAEMDLLAGEQGML